MTAPRHGLDTLALLAGECALEELLARGLSVTPRPAGDDAERPRDTGDELAAIAGIHGERGSGTLCLRVTPAVLARTQPAGPDAHARMTDLAGVVFERIRLRCQTRGLKFEVTSPLVIAGARLRIAAPARAAATAREYTSDAGAIGIAVDFAAQGDAVLFEDRLILVVDDSPAVRQEVRGCLEASGYEVIEASDGAEGVRAVLEHRTLAMVLCDVNMPGMGGIAFVETVKGHERCAGLPIVMLTSEVSTKVCSQALRLGAIGWLVKPFNPSQLLATVDKLTHR